MIRAAKVDFEINLQPLSQFLRHNGVEHRINEESGVQVIWAVDQQQADLVQKVLQSWQSGELQIDNPGLMASTRLGDKRGAKAVLKKLLNAALRSPVTASITLCAVVVAAISGLGRNIEPVEFLFYPMLPSDSLLSLLNSINSPLLLLQALTPMFLHFGELHIIFNVLWLWYFGRQLESVQSSWVFLGVVLITSFVANTSQYLVSHAANFGGLSGVVYGLVGYAWLLHRFVPGCRMQLNNSMFAFFIVALVVMEVFASSWIASAAHAGGLLAGLVLGLMVIVLRKSGIKI